MAYAEVNWDYCKICEDCFARLICNTRAIVKFDPDEPAVIDATKCNGCAKCVAACPFSAISMVSQAGLALSSP